MTVLIIADHQQQQLDEATLHAVTAATQLGEVDILVAGYNINDVAIQAQQIIGRSCRSFGGAFG